MDNPKISYNQILGLLSQNGLLGEYKLKELEAEVGFISHDSREIEKNTLFFSKHSHFKEQKLADALQKGAVCYLSEQKYDFKADYIITSDIRRAIALIAPLYYGYPYESLNLVGITGTKGKTTVAYFLKNIFDEHTKSKTGLISSIETYTGKRGEESHNSTPEPRDLQQFFYEAKQSKINFFTMEVTSQAYKLDRVHNIKFQNGIFLNIAEDHISPAEHDSFEDYLGCKLKFLENCSNIVINRETDCFDRALAAAAGSETLKQIVLFGSEKSKNFCDYYYSEIKKEKEGLSFCIKNDKTGYFAKFAIKTPGLFNVENAAAAVAMCKTLDIDDIDIRAGLLKTQIPGRMNVFENGGVTVIVDYAHNLLSFTKLYESIKFDYPNQRIISVGGAPGEKAYRRRKDFADVVGKNSDYVYLTAEDPQFEDVEAICAEIAGHMPNTNYEIISDRGEAVKKAIKSAKPGDVVALLAKGGENYQKVKGEYEFYESDLEIAKNILFNGGKK
ncbi:MAG: UDP-N-acetylmuramoyl-L-alanyl-D-glutamate--2,6-diaminopimelate ligase [Oscillospiraceae bacterium]|nr:UDP-N-acetylmuramoyl-L-alanyl-D-glutamate--2,6-diaminopimelate ligase [Oscillospiraceae bacterium]